MNIVPWIPYLAQEYLDMIIKPEWSTFEYGSGNSTIYFDQRAAKIISIEHDIEWYNQIKPSLKNTEYKLIQPEATIIGNDKSNPEHYTSNSIIGNFKNYVSAINDYDNFDLIFIDGRSRASCLKHASRKIKNNGWIILDDADRNYYLIKTLHLFDNWETILFSGCREIPWKTLFIRRPNV